MMQTPLIESVDQRATDVLLPHKLVEGAWTPLAGQYLIAHAARNPHGWMAAISAALKRAALVDSESASQKREWAYSSGSASRRKGKTRRADA
ncbi:hypothetical protein GCM10027040_20780 [Halomonas shantousis]